ncbi:MAG: hypothetical protein IKC47_04970 [Clostridia bacterium]|nr:hypothetical protein [Clostridia bacterium]
MTKLNILLTNDDGYQSVGLQQMCLELSKYHNVYVSAPDSQRSACSHAIHFHSPVSFVKLDSYFGAKLAYISSGMPADCVKFGALQFGVKFDLLVSGPNNCENYGHDVLYSATVGGAEEGVVCGIPSVSISRVKKQGGFGHCIDFVVKNAHKLAKFAPQNVFLNVNVPPVEMPVKGIKVARLAGELFDDYFVASVEQKGVYHLTGYVHDTSMMGDCDARWAEEGYITITPMTIVQDVPSLFAMVEEMFDE